MDISQDIIDRVDREMSLTEAHMNKYVMEGDLERETLARGALERMLPSGSFKPRDCFRKRPFRVANHMVYYFLECDETWGDKPAPIKEMAEHISNCFTRPNGSHPAVFFPKGELASAVLFSKKWKANVTGGSTIGEGQVSAREFLCNLYSFMEQRYGVTVRVKTAVPVNRMGSNKIYAGSIDIVDLAETTMRMNIATKCLAAQINNTTIVPFCSIFPSLSIVVFPDGGINIMGLVSKGELELCVDFIDRLFYRFVRWTLQFDMGSIPLLIKKANNACIDNRKKRHALNKAKWEKQTGVSKE